MKIKLKASDFRVLEVPRAGFPAAGGRHFVYRVTKSKWTTLEAAERLAEAAGVDKRCVAFAGLKDRQGITTQFFSVEGGKRIHLTEPGLRVEHVGGSDEPVDSDCITGNAFDITVRELNAEDVRCYRRSKDVVRVQGVPNYFDDQRFGSLRHGQGFVVKEMIEGNLESALKRMLLYPSAYDPPRDAAFKGRLRRAWGDFATCVKLCHGGKHLSVFEHLARNPGDFAGAFRFVSQRLRLIHLYSFQSYLWNLCVSEYLRAEVPVERHLWLRTDMGPVLAFTKLDPPLDAQLLSRTFPLLAPDVRIEDPKIAECVERVLTNQNLTLAKLRVPGVEGFAFKAEERPILVVPRHWRAIRSEPDEEHPGLEKLRLRFELQRGSYATMIVKRLFAGSPEPLTPLAVLSHTGQPRYRKPLGMGIRESGDLPASMRPPGDAHPPAFRPRGKPWRGTPGDRPPGPRTFGGGREDRPRSGGSRGFEGRRAPRRGPGGDRPRAPRRGGPRRPRP